MTAYDQGITRTNLDQLIPVEVAKEIFGAVPQSSIFARLARKLRDMQSGETKLPILSALPTVEFVGEQGRSNQTFDEVKKTTAAAWSNKSIFAEEMACIVPIPENVLEDSTYDVWAEIKPYIAEAVGIKIDSACLFGEQDVTVPISWPDGIFTGMPASKQIALGTGADLYEDLLGEGGVWAAVENSGYMVDGAIAAVQMRSKLRSLRDTAGYPLLSSDPKQAFSYQLDGSPCTFPANGAFNPSLALLIAGAWKEAVWSVRRDVTFKVLTEGVITDNASPRAIIHNLAQDDMVALRVTFRMGWQLPNPINRMDATADRYPFAALVPATSS